MTRSRSEALLVVALSIGLAIAFALLATTQFRFFGDAQLYVAAARDIATGKSLQDGSWLRQFYPPGVPLLLAPAALAFHGSFAAISRWTALLGSLVFPLTWIYVKRRKGWWAWPIAIVTVCSIPFLDQVTDNPMSDVISLALTLALLIWADRWEREPGPGSWGNLLLGCVLLAAMPLARSIGVVAIAAMGLALVMRWHWPRLGEHRVTLRDATPFLIAFGLLLLWYFGLHRERGYLSFFTLADPLHPDLGRATTAQLLLRPFMGFKAELDHAIQLMLPGVPLRPSWFTPALLVIPLILAGWWRDLSGQARFAALYFAGYFAILLVWPFNIGPRYLMGIVPLLWIYLFAGVEQAVQGIRAERPWLRRAVQGCALAAIAGLVLLRIGVLPGRFSLQDAASLLVWLLVVLALTLAWHPLVRLANRITLRPVRILVSLGAIAFAVISISQIGSIIVRRAQGTLPMWGPQAAMARAASWISANLSPEARILTSSPSRLTFATGRPTVPLPYTSAPEQYLPLEREHPQYLLVVEHDSSWAMPNDDMKFAILQKLFPDRWKLVQHLEGASIYAFAPRP